ncbi:MAG: ACP phosphodiesterase [Ferruginibacter sp.]
MNFLAHAYLSFNYPNIVVGNMISDFIKGKKQFDYPSAIQKGIQLHRAIDNFTDTHAATQELKFYFKPQYRLYAGAFADVIYDHFLANDKSTFATDNDLKLFAAGTYKILEDNVAILPEVFQQMLPYMVAQDWLYNYKTTGGIQKSFAGLAKRARYLPETDIAFNIFKSNYDALQHICLSFYPEIKKFTAHHLHNSLHI